MQWCIGLDLSSTQQLPETTTKRKQTEAQPEAVTVGNNVFRSSKSIFDITGALDYL